MKLLEVSAMTSNNIGNARRAYSDSIGNRFTQEDAAKFFGVSIGTYRNWEQGRVEITAAQISAIADLYGTTTDYLIGSSSRSEMRYEETLSRAERRLIQLYRESSDFGKKRIVSLAEAVCAAFPENGGE